ncbi:MAG: thiamine-binding protein [Luminiphilus sp.]|jgi:uncharacterized protein YqgV (UPF0045/DUF77 family)|nr:thiamine-binding protein [Luminiphilus sp.]
MRVTAELSLYPLAGDVEAPVWAFIEHIIASNKCSVATNSMSTQITGDSSDVFDSVRQALEASYEAFGRQVLVAKFIPEHHTDVEPPVAQ